MVFPNIHSPKQLYFYVKKSSTFRLPGFSSGLIYFFIKLLCFHGITSPEEDKTTNWSKKFTWFSFSRFANHTRLYYYNKPIDVICVLPNFRLEMLNAVNFHCIPWAPCLLIILYPNTDEVLDRYRRVLSVEEIHNCGLWKSGSGSQHHCINAPIAELAIAPKNMLNINSSILESSMNSLESVRMQFMKVTVLRMQFRPLRGQGSCCLWGRGVFRVISKN
jgi:hypothetical protein